MYFMTEASDPFYALNFDLGQQLDPGQPRIELYPAFAQCRLGMVHILYVCQMTNLITISGV